MNIQKSVNSDYFANCGERMIIRVSSKCVYIKLTLKDKNSLTSFVSDLSK